MTFCDIPTYSINKKKGSKTEKKENTIIELQTEMFEVCKANLAEVLSNLGIILTNKPKIELFGTLKAEERFLFDLTFPEAGKPHNIKHLIYKTQ